MTMTDDPPHIALHYCSNSPFDSFRQTSIKNRGLVLLKVHALGTVGSQLQSSPQSDSKSGIQFDTDLAPFK